MLLELVLEYYCFLTLKPHEIFLFYFQAFPFFLQMMIIMGVIGVIVLIIIVGK